MSENLIDDFYLFNSLDKSGRVKFICEKIKSLGLIPELQYFHSCFGEGCNVVVNMGESHSKTIITAHYDGESFFDNTGGVFTLFYLVLLCKQIKSKAFTILFTDQEETFQQGAFHYIKQSIFDFSTKNINVDGFGIGDEVFNMKHLQSNSSNQEKYVTDSDVFLKAGYKSTSYFSSFRKDYNQVVLENKSIKSIYSKYIDESF